MDRPAPSYLQNATWNYVGPLVGGLGGLLVLAFVARRVDAVEYGAFLLAVSVAEALMLLDLGLLGILPRAFVAERQQADGVGAQSRLLSAAIVSLTRLASIALAASIIIALLLLSDRVSPLAPEIRPRVSAVVVLVGLMVQVALPTHAIAKAYEASHRFAFLGKLEAILALVRAGGSLLLLAFGLGTVALGIMLVIEALTRAFVLIRFLTRQTNGVRVRFASRDRQALAQAWSPGGWVLLENISNQAIYGIDSIVLGTFSSLRSVAVLGIGRRIPNQLWLAIGRTLGVSLPLMAERHAVGDVVGLRRIFLAACATAAVPAIGCAAALAALARPIIVWLAGPQYADAAVVMRWLLLTTALQSVVIPSILLLYARGRMATSARVTAFEAVANIALSLVLVRSYGAAGVAAATALTHILATFFGFVPAAASAASIRPLELLASVVRALRVPVLSGAAILLLVRLIVHRASLSFVFFEVALASVAYFGAWALVALPARRRAKTLAV